MAGYQQRRDRIILQYNPSPRGRDARIELEVKRETVPPVPREPHLHQERVCGRLRDIALLRCPIVSGQWNDRRRPRGRPHRALHMAKRRPKIVLNRKICIKPVIWRSAPRTVPIDLQSLKKEKIRARSQQKTARRSITKTGLRGQGSVVTFSQGWLPKLRRLGGPDPVHR